MPILSIINSAHITDKTALEHCNDVIFVHSIQDDYRNTILFPLDLRCCLNSFYYRRLSDKTRLKLIALQLYVDKFAEAFLYSYRRRIALWRGSVPDQFIDDFENLMKNLPEDHMQKNSFDFVIKIQPIEITNRIKINLITIFGDKIKQIAGQKLGSPEIVNLLQHMSKINCDVDSIDLQLEIWKNQIIEELQTSYSELG